jgi:hypothetical protein
MRLARTCSRVLKIEDGRIVHDGALLPVGEDEGIASLETGR